MIITGLRRHLVIALLCTAVLAGCSSSSSSSSSSASTTAAADSTTTTVDCPFTGVTTPTSGGTASASEVTLSTVTTSKQGCADNLQFPLSGMTSWKIAYATGPIAGATGAPITTTAPQNLVLTLTNTTWSGAGSTPLKLAVGGLDYITSVNVADGPGNTLLVIMGMNTQVEYMASDSKTPAYVSLGLG